MARDEGEYGPALSADPAWNKAFSDGGPAFPGLAEFGLLFRGEPVPTVTGMTLRDWFAGRAMDGLIEGYDQEARWNSADPKCRTGFDDNPHADSDSTYASQLAQEAYAIADAMLAEREKVK